MVPFYATLQYIGMDFKVDSKNKTSQKRNIQSLI